MLIKSILVMLWPFYVTLAVLIPAMLIERKEEKYGK